MNASEAQRQLEFEERDLNMTKRLFRAAARIRQSLSSDGPIEGHAHILRADQASVFTDFVQYLEEVAKTIPSKAGDQPVMGRIILPPRTGKTVLAAAAIAGSAMMTTFIVPTKALVEQTAREFRKQLPGVAIGTYYSDSKDLVLWGVNVTTYTILQEEFKRKGFLPAPIAVSGLVFADEGHHAMTPDRLTMLSKGFDPQTPRVALTATPDYNAKQTLVKYFPRLIHQITLVEAVELELVAPLRVVVDEVDVDGSVVTIVDGKFQEKTLGRVMAEAPFFPPTLEFRYYSDYRNRSTLICCVTQQQAYDLWKYLVENRPTSRPRPELILADTPTEKRKRILELFDAGAVDTIVNVGVLLEGWSSERCKLLIDLAPSLSRVRALQKFFRPMTKWGDTEAIIYVLKPKGLPEMPLLPMDFFGWDNDTYDQGALIASTQKKRQDKKPAIVRHRNSIIKQVQVKKKEIYSGQFRKPTLDKKNMDAVRAVMNSCPDFRDDKLPAFGNFRALFFKHPTFTGRGLQLLRYLDRSASKETYVTILARYFPESAGALYLRQFEDGLETECTTDAQFMERTLLEGGWRDEGFIDGWLALGGPNVRNEESNPEEILQDKQNIKQILEACSQLKDKERRVLFMNYGLPLSDKKPCSLDGISLAEISKKFQLTTERIRQIRDGAIRKVRYLLLSPDSD